MNFRESLFHALPCIIVSGGTECNYYRMSSAVVGLIGAGIGALAGVAGAVISQYMASRTSQRSSLRSKREEAYSNTLRFLLRARNRRSNLTPEGASFIGKESIKEWFDVLIEAQYWASALTIYCSQEVKEPVTMISNHLNYNIEAFIAGETRMIDPAITAVGDAHLIDFDVAYDTILRCARDDIGNPFLRV